MWNRRAFLKFLAGNPLLANAPVFVEALAQTTQGQTTEDLLASAADAIDVFDFDAVARKVVPPAQWGYMATGVDGEETLKANTCLPPISCDTDHFGLYCLGRP